MILLADSGSTKTDWWLLDAHNELRAEYKTKGINPFHLSDEEIDEVLTDELLPQLEARATAVSAIFFYGSGVRPELEEAMAKHLALRLPSATRVEAHGDLLGAARALLGTHEGVGCILGTGSNSCIFDGQRIVANTPPLGYILGDEGSGAALGICLVNALYKGRLPQTVVDDFTQHTGMSLAQVVARVYRQPHANRWLASLSPFIHERLCMDEMRYLVVSNFRLFLQRNVAPYRRPDLAVSFVGSIAWHYRDELAEALRAENLLLGKVVRSPLGGLSEFHDLK
mgnify:CR=1 FL=1